MSEPFLSEIKMVGFNFAPRGWALCDGQNVPINQNQVLFALLGTTFGGDGRTTFALPDLRGRTPVHRGQGFGMLKVELGQKGGAEVVTLTSAQVPSHTHQMPAGSLNHVDPQGTYVAKGATNMYIDRASASNSGKMDSSCVSNAGGGQAHNNMQPSLAINFCIALQGAFPSRN